MMGRILHLMARSPVHSDWTVKDIWRLIMPPIIRGFYIEKATHNTIWGFATYGFFSDEALEGYRTGKRKIQELDFNSGNNIVLIDVIAPYGDAKNLMYSLRQRLHADGHQGKYIWFKRKYADRERFARVMI